MKFSLDQADAGHVITAYRPGEVRIGRDAYGSSLLLCSAEIDPSWSPTSCAQIDFDVLVQRAAEWKSELLVLGTGARQVFPEPEQLAPLMAAAIGFEIMDTGAACRTYNVLRSEGRPVMAALILD